MGIHRAWIMLLTVLRVVASYMYERNILKELQLTSPPRIIDNGDHRITYTLGEQLDIPCVALGDPQPRYRWEKDGAALDVSGGRIMLVPEQGLRVTETLRRDKGIYQCFAQNEFGVAVGVKNDLRQATIGTFARTSNRPHTHNPMVGQALTLWCNPPRSFPKGIIYWAESKNGKISSIEMTSRISQDYDGNLHFANVKESDWNPSKPICCVLFNTELRALTQGGGQLVRPQMISGNLYFANILAEDSRNRVSYVCIIENPILRSLRKGEDQLIVPETRKGDVPERAPILVWPSAADNMIVILIGEELKLKCIFSGYPTPTILWRRLGGDSFGVKVRHTSFGQEIVVPNIELSDAGDYQCSASNSVSDYEVSQIFNVRVESMPIWLRSPQNVNSAEDEDAEFFCEADGAPRPTIMWYSNGVPLTGLEDTAHRQVQENRIVFLNLTSADIQVIQCNASNKHGYIFANAFLNVLAEPPSFIKRPEPIVKAALGQDVTLRCRVFGAPKPVISWKKDNMEISNKRVSVMKNDDLLIKNVEESDKGIYNCRAWNKFGHDDASSELIVRERTRIVTGSQWQETVVGANVTFRCRAVTDPAEIVRLIVVWQRDGQTLQLEHEPRVAIDTDGTLTLARVTVDDSADYTCEAMNGIDSDRVTATLVVKDRPAAPTDIRLVGCTTTRASITWQPGRDNNSPISDYFVYYNTSFDEAGSYHNVTTARTRGENSRNIRVSPWAKYTFHVRARNAVGLSARSAFTQASCITEPNIPMKNPRGVCIENRSPGKLVITWKKMPKIDHNGEGFHYIVRYRLASEENAAFSKEVVSDWRQRSLVVDGDYPYTKFVFSVQASNAIGQSPERSLRRFQGYSGENKPLEVPYNFRLHEDTLNATSGRFSWDPVDRSLERIRGFFKGYQIQFWRSDSPDHVRTHDVILEQYRPCEPYRGAARRLRRELRQVDATIVTLWPDSTISAAVRVLTGGQQGDLGDHIQFVTPEGVPGPVSSFTVMERGSHHLRLSWTHPYEINGVLIGYRLGYTAGSHSPTIDLWVGNVTTFNLRELQPDLSYRLYIWATTNAGRGEMYFIEENTVFDSGPDVPQLLQTAIEDNAVNVSWRATHSDVDPVNPGSQFYVEYRLLNDDDEPWGRSETETDQSWTNVSGLINDHVYEMRVVALTGDGKKARTSTITEVRIGPVGVVPNITIAGSDGGAVQQNIASAEWFIGLLIAIAILILILIIICCLIKRNRGGKYPVHQKEMLRGNDPEKEADKPFGEYAKSEEPEHKKSLGSIESEDKPLESDMESLAEYYDLDNAKFNEEGSFIGMYGAKRAPEEKPLMQANDASTTPLSSFV